MTTILGIKANADDHEAVVLAADTQLNLYEGSVHTGKIESPNSKIRVIKNSAAIAIAGDYDKYVEAFINYLGGNRDLRSYLSLLSGSRNPPDLDNISFTLNLIPKGVKRKLQDIIEKKQQPTSDLENILTKLLTDSTQPETELDKVVIGIFKKLISYQDPLQEALKTEYFLELNHLNRFFEYRNSEDEDFDASDSSELIIATTPNCDLFHVDHRGNVYKIINSELIDYIAIGSGSDIVNKYFDEMQYIKDQNFGLKFTPDNITTKMALKLARTALIASLVNQDTGGYIERVVVHKDGIDHHGSTVREKLAREEEQVNKAIEDQYE
ncbi:hypothetical protein J4471_03470 [Candidatus Woesearchaeota archaeon]|nr:hypothetical protein [Candidatus Woesearchaeota archaeon]